MAYKPRTEPVMLKILRYLNARMVLSENEKQYYLTLKKGYEGEVKFDLLTEKISSECFVLNDLLLEVNNTLFQIDTTLIFQDTIYLLDVKNHEGDYIFESGEFFTMARKDIKNPLQQLKRSKSLFRQLLHNLGYHFNIESNVIFINPAFTLYQNPLNEPIIFPTQLDRYMKKLDTIPSKLNSRHKKLADQLISLHIRKSPYTHSPKYNYGMLRKGLSCGVCDSLSIFASEKKCVCADCGHEEAIDTAVLRSILELKVLFPEMKITTNLVHDWCSGEVSIKSIRRILKQNLTTKGSTRFCFYE
ncbi:nuclease-related domain-containing protein [Neobacillus drentensis]|uniref:nuclease-related domain-containing protein n=1 Tax=Neobacillus drentensis TaxID=220684 RepID=UPI002FFF666E